ncbi:hypothetical protein HYPDE_23943 [Hyphomicrobium denitrificans 1NES1]|uniref:Uncharacterized protein n=1 Tax=Hyphomicrobium denitrificans 1NES1 TaxID=670307 RepID=N0AZC8_9HYPH|nr:hypothetical protein HYPDE_23943 [Hyphomicrobium denitrificans 1NES1]
MHALKVVDQQQKQLTCGKTARASGIFLDAMQRTKTSRAQLPGLLKIVLNQIVVTVRAATSQSAFLRI